MAERRILADQNIPRVERAFGEFGTVQKMSGHDIGPAAVQNADVLLVRSVTSVGPELLEGSDVRFVGSATIGTDHVDLQYLQAQNIRFAHAPGSNATSVADYVIVALLDLARRQPGSLRDRTVGVVGCGNIGGRLANRLPALGLTVLRNDPPLADAAEEDGRAHPFVPLERVFEEADIITLHVPLKTGGPHPTHHLVDAEALRRLEAGTWLVNTSRGAVVDGDALREARAHGPVEAAVLDVWEDEPAPDPTLIDLVDVATPHIAGYAYDGKVRGTYMLYRALCGHLGVKPTWDPATVLRPASGNALRCTPPDPRLPTTEWLCALARQAYDLRADDASMRDLSSLPRGDRANAFTRLRAEYRQRRELRQHTVPQWGVPAACHEAVDEGLTIQIG